MPLLPLEQLLAHVDSKYRLVVIAAKRAKQLMHGGGSLITSKSFKPTYTALEEIAAGKVNYVAEPVGGALAQELIAPKSTKPTYTALEEIGAGKLTYEAEHAQGALPEKVLPPEGIPTWIRSLSAEETLGEGVTVEEEDEEKEELEIEEAAPELLAEASEEPGEPEMTGLDALEAPEAAEDEA